MVLLQRSEGGALGIGGGNAFMSSRGQGNVLTRATGILAAAFFATSIVLTVLTRMTAPPVLDPRHRARRPPCRRRRATTHGPASDNGTGGILDELNRFTDPPRGRRHAPADGSTTTARRLDGTTPPARRATTLRPSRKFQRRSR